MYASPSLNSNVIRQFARTVIEYVPLRFPASGWNLYCEKAAISSSVSALSITYNRCRIRSTSFLSLKTPFGLPVMKNCCNPLCFHVFITALFLSYCVTCNAILAHYCMMRNRQWGCVRWRAGWTERLECSRRCDHRLHPHGFLITLLWTGRAEGIKVGMFEVCVVNNEVTIWL